MDAPEAPLICEVTPDGPAGRAGVRAGARLLAVNGVYPRDILEYYRLTDGRHVTLDVEPGGRLKIVKREGEPLGMAFEEAVFDGVRICRNRCVFCFVDQMPAGLRRSLYMKDDDYRLSLLWGNFVTLTNLSDEEHRRIIDERISPLFVSLHTTDPVLHERMVRPRDEGSSQAAIDRLSALLDNGIDVHVQIVLCPGWNDGDALTATLSDLSPEGPLPVSSVGIVPVGLTALRSETDSGRGSRLTDLEPVTGEVAASVIDRVTPIQRTYRRAYGHTQVYLADEFYLKAGRPLPPFAWYDDFPQLGNGIGLCARFQKSALARIRRSKRQPEWGRATILTGELVAPVLELIAGAASAKWQRTIRVLPVVNGFFGGGVSVTPLLTAADILESLTDAAPAGPGQGPGSESSLLSDGPIFLSEGIFGDEGVTLDGIAMKDLVSRAAAGLGLDLRVLPDDGGRMISAMERCPR